MAQLAMAIYHESFSRIKRPIDNEPACIMVHLGDHRSYIFPGPFVIGKTDPFLKEA